MNSENNFHGCKADRGGEISVKNRSRLRRLMARNNVLRIVMSVDLQIALCIDTTITILTIEFFLYKEKITDF